MIQGVFYSGFLLAWVGDNWELHIYCRQSSILKTINMLRIERSDPLVTIYSIFLLIDSLIWNIYKVEKNGIAVVRVQLGNSNREVIVKKICEYIQSKEKYKATSA